MKKISIICAMFFFAFFWCASASAATVENPMTEDLDANGYDIFDAGTITTA